VTAVSSSCRPAWERWRLLAGWVRPLFWSAISCPWLIWLWPPTLSLLQVPRQRRCALAGQERSCFADHPLLVSLFDWRGPALTLSPWPRLGVGVPDQAPD